WGAASGADTSAPAWLLHGARSSFDLAAGGRALQALRGALRGLDDRALRAPVGALAARSGGTGAGAARAPRRGGPPGGTARAAAATAPARVRPPVAGGRGGGVLRAPRRRARRRAARARVRRPGLRCDRTRRGATRGRTRRRGSLRFPRWTPRGALPTRHLRGA